MNNAYELTYIIPATAGESNISSIQSRVEGVLVENGCVKKDINNSFTSAQKKKLSYEMDKVQFGYYITIYFDADPAAIEKISKILKLDSDILRYLIISVKGDIPQGVVVSKKEVEQQIDNAIEDLIAESKQDKEVKDSAIQKSEDDVNTQKSENQEEKAAEGSEDKADNQEQEKEKTAPKISNGGGTDKKVESGVDEKEDTKKKISKKASFEDLDKKLDEILSE